MDSNPKTILVIDSSQESCTLIGQLLRQEGAGHVMEANSTDQALALLGPDERAASFASAPALDLILLDLAMPNLDAAALCHQLKANPQTTDVPIIIMTTASTTNLLPDVLSQGALDYVTKPLAPMELSARVKSALRLKEEIDLRRRLAGQLAEAQQMQERTAQSDGLTGLANRRYFDEFLDKEWRRCRREQQPVTLCLLELDFFKAYNEAYGHHQGDACLKKVAAILAACVKRPADLLARYGSNEFAIILAETPESGACAVLKRIMQEVASRNIPHAHSPISDRLTLSCGVAMLTPKAATPINDLLAQADRALHEAQTLGRNQISCPGLTGHTLSAF